MAFSRTFNVCFHWHMAFTLFKKRSKVKELVCIYDKSHQLRSKCAKHMASFFLAEHVHHVCPAPDNFVPTILWGPNLPHALKVWLLCANHSTWINQSHSKNEQTPQGSNGSDVGGPAVHDAPGQKASRWKMEWNGTCRAKQWNLMEWGNTLQGNGATQGNEMELTRQRRQPSLLLPCQDRCSTLINFQMEQGFIKVYNGRGS